MDLYRKHDWRITDITFTPDSDDTFGGISGAIDMRNLSVLKVTADDFANSLVGWPHWREDAGLYFNPLRWWRNNKIKFCVK